jgi:hypothetical protein
MDKLRHEADSEVEYEYHFNLLHGKIEEYHILAGNTYNMDEKGFIIRQTRRSKRVFSKELYKRKEVRDLPQDSLRE